MKCTGSTCICELGDLMTVFLLLDKNKNIVCSTAKIMQVKKQDNLNSESQKCLCLTCFAASSFQSILTPFTIRLSGDYMFLCKKRQNATAGWGKITKE
jgi:hypothetical protein